MDTKLTIKLDEDVIERAKKYASNKKVSLSRLIENYLNALTSEQNMKVEISPFVKSIATGKSVPVDIDEREMYRESLTEKYQ